MIFKCCLKGQFFSKKASVCCEKNIRKGNFFIEEDSLHAGRSPPLFPPYILEKSVSANAAPDTPPVDLHLNFEKSSWKNQVRQTGFLACKNQFRN